MSASPGPGEATARAQELRASLGARQEAEVLLAEAGRIRQDAAAAADALVAEAQQLSEQLVAESRLTAEQITGEARAQAEDVLARARVEAEGVAERARASAEAIRSAAESEIEEHRRRVRAEVTDQVTRALTEQHRLAEERAQQRSVALISDLEASVRILGVSLESALANVGELLGSIEGLRSPTDPADEAMVDEAERGDLEPRVAAANGLAHAGDAVTVVVDAHMRFGPEVEVADQAPVDRVDARPRSATEAFLSSSSLEIEQAGRELADLQHPEQARRRRGDESRLEAELREAESGDSDDEVDTDPHNARPLGWLFRTAQ